MLNQRNTKTQGDVGVGQAIGYFTSLGWIVSIPLSDNQPYDLVVDYGEGLQRVQVKTTRFRASENASYVAQLSTQGGNQSWQGTIKKFSGQSADYVFVFVDDGSRYFIPADLLDQKSSVTLTKAWDVFRV